MLLLIVGMLVIAIPRKKKQPQLQLSAANMDAAIAAPKFLVPEVEEPIPEIATEERSEIKKQLEKFVKQKPDAVAQLLRNWLSDDWDS
jgi:flagellar M-ring protein FliF